MAYQAGDTILDDEYNAFINNSSSPFGLNHIGGTGSAKYGLGESDVATVNAGDTINASHWNSLFTGIDTVAAHCGVTGSMTSRSSVSAGDTIAIANAVATDLATLATQVSTGSPSTTATSLSATLQTSTSDATWYTSFTTAFTITFANANKLRHFFNAGGFVRVHAAVTGSGLAGDGTGPGADASWTNLYSALGNIDIKQSSSTRSGSGETLTTNGLSNGALDLGTTDTTIIKLTDDTYPYGSNTLEVKAKLNAAVGSATIMTVTIVALDGLTNYVTYTSGNTEGSDSESYRSGQHSHYLKTQDTTAASLANAHAPSSTGKTSTTVN